MVLNLEEMSRAYAARRDDLDRSGVYFLRDITDEAAEDLSKTVLIMSMQRQGFPDSTLTIYINSGGGSVGAGFAIMEMLFKIKRDFGIKIHTVITGYAYSMGAIVFQAGDVRSMGHFSTMMLHGSTWQLVGEDRKVFEDYEKLSSHYQRLMGELFANRTGKRNPRWWIRYIYSGRDRFLSAQESLQLGLTDNIVSLQACYPELVRRPTVGPGT